MNSFTWGEPFWLLGLLVLLVAAVLESIFGPHEAAQRWPRIQRLLAGPEGVEPAPPIETGGLRLFLLVGLAFCVLALARPQWGEIEEPVFDQAREVMLALDLSQSMMAEDVRPSRLDRAKVLLESCLDQLKGERVGLILFGGTAFLQSPLSSDYEVLREFLPLLEPSFIPDSGTDYRPMLKTSLEAFGSEAGTDRFLVVLSDGESQTAAWKELVSDVKERGIRVIGLGVGTAVGGLVPSQDGGFIKDERGAAVLSKLNPSTLQELASQTKGVYEDASGWVDIASVIERTVETGKKGSFEDKRERRKIERFQWFLAAGFVLLLLSLWKEFPAVPKMEAQPWMQRVADPATLQSNQDDVIPSQHAGIREVPPYIVRILLLSTLGAIPVAAQTVEQPAAPPAPPGLAEIVGQVADNPVRRAKDYATVAEATIDAGRKGGSSDELKLPMGVIDDALAAVEAGRAMDAKAADWDQLKEELEKLKQKNQPPPEDKNSQKNDQHNQQQNQQGQQNQQQQQQQDGQGGQGQEQNQNKDSQQQEGKGDQTEQKDPGQQKSQDGKQEEKEGSEGSKKEDDKQGKGDQEGKDPKEKKPSSPTQKVGGKKEGEEQEGDANPMLAEPLRKLDQVREGDSPAKLFQMLESGGQKTNEINTGKQW